MCRPIYGDFRSWTQQKGNLVWRMDHSNSNWPRSLRGTHRDMPLFLSPENQGDQRILRPLVAARTCVFIFILQYSSTRIIILNSAQTDWAPRSPQHIWPLDLLFNQSQRVFNVLGHKFSLGKNVGRLIFRKEMNSWNEVSGHPCTAICTAPYPRTWKSSQLSAASSSWEHKSKILASGTWCT